MHGDMRSRRVAVVADAVVNPPDGAADELDVLEREGWGVVVLPPPDLVPEAREPWLAAVVEEVVTFLDDGYEVVLRAGGPEADGFRAALAAPGRELPPRHSYASAGTPPHSRLSIIKK
jgi:hypothetical protein